MPAETREKVGFPRVCATNSGCFHSTPMTSNGSRPTSDELLRLMVEGATGYAIFSTDRSGKVTSWNVGAQRVLGFAADEMLGTSADVIFTAEDRAAGVPDRERRDASSKGRAVDDRWTLRKGGERFWASGLMMPLADRDRGYVKILRDRTEMHLSELRHRVDAERFRVLATNIPQLVFRCRPDGRRTWGSPQWISYTGLDLPASLEYGWMEAVHPDDREKTQFAWIAASKSGAYEVEHRLRRQLDGDYRWHQTRALPIATGEDPSAEDWVGTSTDIHELRGLRDHQQVLLAELQHRTRNLLGLAQAIAARLVRQSATLDQFWQEFQSRLGALGRVQALLGASEAGVSLRDLLEAEMGVHAARGDHRIAMDGPPVILPDRAAQMLALAFHELVTNTVKHGALRVASGRVDVRWGVDRERRLLRIRWEESGVVVAPSEKRRSGFGTELLQRALPYQLGGTTDLSFPEAGFRCLIAIPFARAP